MCFGFNFICGMWLVADIQYSIFQMASFCQKTFAWWKFRANNGATMFSTSLERRSFTSLNNHNQYTNSNTVLRSDTSISFLINYSVFLFIHQQGAGNEFSVLCRKQLVSKYYLSHFIKLSFDWLIMAVFTIAMPSDFMHHIALNTGKCKHVRHAYVLSHQFPALWWEWAAGLALIGRRP